MGAFAASIFIMIVLVVFGAVNCGWGIAVAAVLQIVLAGFFFVLSAAIAVGMVMLSDSCQNSEVVLIQFSPSQLKSLVRLVTSTSDLSPSRLTPTLPIDFQLLH